MSQNPYNLVFGSFVSLPNTVPVLGHITKNAPMETTYSLMANWNNFLPYMKPALLYGWMRLFYSISSFFLLFRHSNFLKYFDDLQQQHLLVLVSIWFLVSINHKFSYYTLWQKPGPIAERSNLSFVTNCRGRGDPNSNLGRV